MSNISPITGATGISLQSLEPRPRWALGQVFRSVLAGVRSVFADSAANFGGIDPTFAGLIEAQIEAQEQLQLVSFVSNIEKSKHETQMAAIRNIRNS
ncbi:MAG TPA: hypothetical protein PKD37_06215 [Oligoflexia bacterium]|nr:hypothetical protein [Oligoflexia bacterium]HMP27556.1 hypothetical protein [Oligoflexia bacterium]